MGLQLRCRGPTPQQGNLGLCIKQSGTLHKPNGRKVLVTAGKHDFSIRGGPHSLLEEIIFQSFLTPGDPPEPDPSMHKIPRRMRRMHAVQLYQMWVTTASKRNLRPPFRLSAQPPAPNPSPIPSHRPCGGPALAVLPVGVHAAPEATGRQRPADCGSSPPQAAGPAHSVSGREGLVRFRTVASMGPWALGLPRGGGGGGDPPGHLAPDICWGAP